MPPPTPKPSTRRVPWLPRGEALRTADFTWRHRVVCVLLAAHLPLVVLVAALTGRSSTYGLLELVPLAALLAVALAPLGRRSRALSASLGLLTCSAMFVYLFDGAVEAHAHYFLAVAVIALYQDWTVYVLAIGFVALHQGVLVVLSPSSVYAGDGRPWVLASVHAAFVLAESAVLVLFWHANEQARAEEERLRVALAEGSSSLRARLDEADRMRADLIGTVSHEFRTPLTGIRGAALTLLKRGDRLDPDSRTRMLHAVLDQQERLSRLLENMLTAAQATQVDLTAVAEVDAVAAEVAMLAVAARPAAGQVQVLVDPGTTARIDRQALHQVLANLIDNAQQHGARGAVPIVAGGRDAAGVWLTVSNDGSNLDADAASRLFEPFTQADGGATRDREGLGMGLYVVRRLVEVHGGHVSVRTDDGWVTVEVRLPVTGSPAESRPQALAG